MPSAVSEQEEIRRYRVVLNHEEQYSIWPEHKELPLGWTAVGEGGFKEQCLAFIDSTWTDIRPLSLRKRMAEAQHQPGTESASFETADTPPDDLVDRLCAGEQPVEAGIRPMRTLQGLKAALDRSYLDIIFTNTKGGTELGVRIDKSLSDFSGTDFEKGTGRAHIQGTLWLNSVNVRCIATIDLSTFAGTAYLIRLEQA